jgi:cell division protein FtsL
MEVFKFDKEKLVFKKTNLILKHRLIIGMLVLSIFLLSFSMLKINDKVVELKTKIDEKEYIIESKNKKIELIKEPLREDTYIEDLYRNIGFKLTKEEYNRFSKLALKYKTDIEKAKVPATLVWWTAYKESEFNPNAKNPESTAKGMFQFLDGTWNGVCKLKGYDRSGRFDEDKQIQVMLAYLNYLYNKYGSWEKSMVEYHGGEYQYPITFLFK